MRGVSTIRWTRRREADSQAAYIECVSHSSAVGYPIGVAYGYEGLAALAVRRGDAVRGARLLGASARLRDAVGFPLEVVEQAIHDDVMRQLELVLSSETFSREWAAGRELEAAAAVAYALSLD